MAVSKIAVAKKLRELAGGILLGENDVNCLYHALTMELDNFTNGNPITMENINIIWRTYPGTGNVKMNKGNMTMMCELSLAVLGDSRIEQTQIEKHLRTLNEIKL